MNGFDWNGNGSRDSFDEYMDYKLSGCDEDDDDDKEPGGGGGSGCGCSTAVIIIVAILLVCFLFQESSWEAMESLLGLGFIAFLIVRWLYG